MFNNIFNDHIYQNKKALIMANYLPACQQDLKILQALLTDFEIIQKINCYPKQEIISFLTNNKNADLIYIHYSGHGVKRGRKVDGNMKILTCWVNPDNTVVSSVEIDTLFFALKCAIILTTDCCHSQTFGQYYFGKAPYIFIGTSLLSEISKTSVADGGSLINTFKYLSINNIIINLENIKEYHIKLFNKKLVIYHKV
jgi:hypothetical protein